MVSRQDPEPRGAGFSGCGWLSISAGCYNRGNQLIEHATRELLGVSSALVASSFEEPDEGTLEALAACRLIVLPGATQLDVREHPIAAALARLAVPKLALGVAFQQLPGRPPDLDIARALDLPVGSRDPYTHQVLTTAGIESRLVGCSTLFLGSAGDWCRRRGPIVVSLGLGRQRPLQACVAACAGLGETVLFEHVPELQPRFVLPPGVRRVEMESVEQALEIYGGASVVLTGRIHGCLPAIALGTPVVFFGAWRDSRYSLLDHLGVEVLPSDPERVRGAVAAILEGAMPPRRCFEQAAGLRAAMTSHLGQLRERGLLR